MENGHTLAIELDRSCMECAASYDSKNEASSGLSIELTCTCTIPRRHLIQITDNHGNTCHLEIIYLVH